MPGGVGGAVQAARFAGGLGAACCVLGSVRRGAFPSQGRVQHVPVWLLVRRRSDRGRGGCCSRRGLRSASSAGPLLLGAGLWSCWWFSPCLICGWSPRRNMDAAGNAGGGLAVWFFPIVSAGRRPVSSCKRKSLSGLIVGRAFVLCAVCGCACWALCRRARILYHSSRRGTLCGFQRGQGVRVSLPDLGAHSGNGRDVAPVCPISYRGKQAPAHLCA